LDVAVELVRANFAFDADMCAFGQRSDRFDPRAPDDDPVPLGARLPLLGNPSASTAAWSRATGWPGLRAARDRARDSR
jgi:hypothetical protein